MLDHLIINSCFENLKDSGLSLAKESLISSLSRLSSEEFLQKKEEVSRVESFSDSDFLHYLVDIAPSNLYDYEDYDLEQDAKDLQTKKSAGLRKEALQVFLSKNKEFLAFEDVCERSILQKAISAAMFFGKDLILQMIADSENIDTYLCGSKTSTPESFGKRALSEDSKDSLTLIEYLINQEAFSGELTEISEIAIALLEKGSSLDLKDLNKLRNLLNERAVSSGLTKALCEYFLEKEDCELFLQLLRIADTKSSKSGSQSSESRSRKGSRASSVGLFDSKFIVTKLFKELIDFSIKKDGLINRAQDSSRETMPLFLLRKRNEHNSSDTRRYDIATSVWSYLQARSRISSLTTELLSKQSIYSSMMHQVVKAVDATMLDGFIKKIESESEEDKKAIYSIVNKDGQSAFHLACKIGFDTAIKRLFSRESCEELDNGRMSPLLSAIEAGKSKTCEILLEKGVDIESSKAVCRPLCMAVLQDKEGISEILLKNGADPNAKSLIVGYEGGRETCALKEALMSGNVDLIKLLMEYGANFKNEDAKYLKEYDDFKNDPRNSHIVADLDDCEIKAARHFALKDVSLKLLREFGEVFASKQELADRFVKNGQFGCVFDIYHELSSKTPTVSPSPSSASLSSQGSRGYAM